MLGDSHSALDLIGMPSVSQPNQLDVDAMHKVLKSRIDEYYKQQGNGHQNKQNVRSKVYSKRRPASAIPRRKVACPTPSDPATQRNRDLTSHEALYEQVVRMKQRIRELEKENTKLSSQVQRYSRLANASVKCPSPLPVPRQRPCSARGYTARKPTSNSRSVPTPAVRYEELVKLRDEVKQLASMGEQQMKVIQRRDVKISVLEARAAAYEHLDEFAKAMEAKSTSGAKAAGPSLHQQNKVMTAQFSALRRQNRYIALLEEQLLEAENHIARANVRCQPNRTQITAKQRKSTRPASAIVSRRVAGEFPQVHNNVTYSKHSRKQSKIVYERDCDNAKLSPSTAECRDNSSQRIPKVSDVKVEVFQVSDRRPRTTTLKVGSSEESLVNPPPWETVGRIASSAKTQPNRGGDGATHQHKQTQSVIRHTSNQSEEEGSASSSDSNEEDDLSASHFYDSDDTEPE